MGFTVRCYVPYIFLQLSVIQPKFLLLTVIYEINVKKILAVINATYAVAKRKPEKIRNPGKPDFFRLSFRNCISCVNNCEDLLYIYFFIQQFKYMNFIYS